MPDLSHIDFEDEFTADAHWTDIFVYLVEIEAVEEGAIIAFFSDLNPENTENTICYQQIVYARELFASVTNQFEETDTGDARTTAMSDP